MGLVEPLHNRTVHCGAFQGLWEEPFTDGSKPLKGFRIINFLKGTIGNQNRLFYEDEPQNPMQF